MGTLKRRRRRAGAGAGGGGVRGTEVARRAACAALKPRTCRMTTNITLRLHKSKKAAPGGIKTYGGWCGLYTK